jgi:hypothetical protein
MSGSGAIQTNRFATFTEVFLSREFYCAGPTNLGDGFLVYSLFEGQDSGTVNITRSDGKTLSFDVKRTDILPAIEIGGNVIRWTAYPELHSDGPFQ